ncbi:hypothetical protein CLV90_2043 [Maribacter spongiicola]|uniref:Uncharacterized protein n=1 Tax=Maribacter spongiicola TaxID=1206753 RepID=A0A4R7K3D2_9FLAO|nr:hypothetical protein [Maribacter spongiicola]TDT44964.1 hypothetical protein CLV90_2043 [Maribacter spongiicola]
MEKLRIFIQERKAFNHSYLARESQWDKLDFSKWIRNKIDVVPQRVLDNLKKVLSLYGYE